MIIKKGDFIKIFKVQETDIENDLTLQRAFSNEEINLKTCIKYILKKYGCRNKNLQQELESPVMYKFGIKKLDGSLFGFHPYYSSLKIYPQEAIVKGETRCFYVNCSWSDGYGTTFRPDYEIHLFPIDEGVKVENIIDSNFKGNFEVKSDSIMIKKYF